MNTENIIQLSEYDKQIASKKQIENIFIKVFPESYLQNGIGSAYDVTMPKNWNIPLDQIKSKIILWQAEKDVLAGNMTIYIANKLPSYIDHQKQELVANAENIIFGFNKFCEKYWMLDVYKTQNSGIRWSTQIRTV